MPFANKAFHLDDYLFLRAARQILEHPLDPYGTGANWYGFEMPLAQITQNPPGAAYYLAAAAKLFGWSEPALHGAFLLPALAAVLGTHALARRFCAQPVLAALVALVTPVFWLSATTLMCDVPMLALWLWATECWLRALETGRHRWFAAAALLVAGAALTKYFAAALVPLLCAYTVASERRVSWKLLWFLLPVLALAGYDLATGRLYGQGLLSGAADYIRQDHVAQTHWRHSLVLLSFAGGCLLPLLFLAPFLWSRRQCAAGAAVFLGLVAALASLESVGNFSLREHGAVRWSIVLQLALLASVGASLLALVAADLRHKRSADSLLLALWVLGTLVFASAVNWTINGRSLLPLAPATAILIARRLSFRAGAGTGVRRRLQHGALLAAAGAAAVVVQADARLADNSRAAANALLERLGSGPNTVWFQGHWGFQYYMERGGARPLDRDRSELRTGDYVISPDTNTNVVVLPPSLFTEIGEIEATSGRVLTMHLPSGAGFYSDGWGPLPFVVGPCRTERFSVARRRPASWF